MRRSFFFLGAFCFVFLGACGSNGGDDSTGWDSGDVPDGSVPDRYVGGDSSSNKDGTSSMDSSTSKDSTVGCGTSCPTGYACGTANGFPVCRSMTSTIPLFTNVYVIMMENTTLATLEAGTIPNLKKWQAAYATGSDYHGVSHPSLPNYVALTSGGTQGIGCDCGATHGGGGCTVVGDYCFSCSCDLGSSVKNLGDQLETAGKTWMDFGESMGTACNMTDSGNYAQRHNPFLYYDDIQLDATRCKAHVVDYTSFKVASPANFNFIAPNLCNDMHNTCTGNNLTTGDTWLGMNVPPILGSTGYTTGGLLVIVWDEDDSSGGLFPPYTDDPIGIWVFSPYAKSGGYVSSVMANHYSLLATIEDGLDVGRLGSAATAKPLADYFPAN